MKLNQIISPLLTTALLLGVGCKENDINENDINTDANRQYEIAGKLGSIAFNGRELINEFGDDDFIVDNDSMLMRSFVMPMSMEWNDLAAFTTPSLNQNYNIPASAAFSFTEIIQMNPSADVRLDQMILNDGQLNLRIVVPSAINSGKLTVSLPDVRKNGSSLSYTLDISSSQHTLLVNELLKDAIINFQQTNDVAPHNSHLRLTISLSNLSPNVGGNMEVSFGLNNLQSQVIYGYFGKKTMSKNDYSFAIDMFDEYSLESEVTFADFQIFIQGINPMGTPFEMTVKNIRLSKENEAGSQWLLSSNDNLTPLAPKFILNKAPELLQPDTAETVIINRDNSNIEDIGTKLPNLIQCDLSGISNPTATTSTQSIKNFIGADKTVKANLMINFPFWFNTKGYTRTDTINFDFNDIIGIDETSQSDDDYQEFADNIERFQLFLDFANCMPFTITAQARVVDENDVLITNLLEPDQQIIEAAKPDNNCKIETAKNTNVELNITQEQFKLFYEKKARKIILDLKTVTYDAQNGTMVKIFTTNSLKATVSLDAKSRIPNF
jgi:hypothetical protein